MKNFRQHACLAVAVLALLMSPAACRTRKKPVATPSIEVPPPPDMSAPEVSTPVKPPDDFVREQPVTPEPRVTTEDIPVEIEAASRLAQERGWIQDAMFSLDESTLGADAQEALSLTAIWLKGHPQYNLLIEGHCDERGTEQYNLALGDRRANTAKDYLTTLGVDSARVRTVSYGEERPFDSGHDESSWGRNRRAHLVLVRR